MKNTDFYGFDGSPRIGRCESVQIRVQKNTSVSVAATMACITHTRVFTNEKIFSTRKTIFRVTKKMLSGFVTIMFVSQTMVEDDH